MSSAECQHRVRRCCSR